MQGYWRGLPFTSPGNLSSPGSILLHCICGMHGGLWYLAFSSVQFSRSVVSNPLRPHELQHARPPCPSPSPGVNPKLMCIKSVMPSSHLIFCHSLLLLPSIFPSIRIFSSKSVLCIKWPKYWSFSLSIKPSSEYSGLIFFRIDWFDLCVVQGTLNCLLQHHSSKASILRCSAFFMVQISYPYVTTGKQQQHNFDHMNLCQQSNVSAF